MDIQEDRTSEFAFADEFGPEKIIQIYDPATKLKAVLVVDNTAAGPSIGGVRMAPDVTTAECFRLARAMTLKNAMAGLSHGGGKSVIAADPKMPAGEKTRLMRSFAHAIRDIKDYIPGPDMGTNEILMAQVNDVTGRAVGLPREVGGIPLDEIGATGYGVCVALEVIETYTDFKLEGARIVVQGFGSVGIHAARFLVAKGALLTGVSDSQGARICASGFDLDQLLTFKQSGHSVVNFEQGESIPADDLVAVECDVWIPAARPDVLRADNVTRMNTKVIAEGANIPTTIEAESILAQRGVVIIPDFVANAGGVICAAVEYHRGTEIQAMTSIEEKIRSNVSAVFDRVAVSGELPRQAASNIAIERVRKAMSYRRTY